MGAIAPAYFWRAYARVTASVLGPGVARRGQDGQARPAFGEASRPQNPGRCGQLRTGKTLFFVWMIAGAGLVFRIGPSVQF